MLNFRRSIQDRKLHLNPRFSHWLLFTLILGLGVFARTWEFRSLPPGLNPDEASIGVEAYDLSHYGIDRNGVSYPVHFVSWANGQNALYGYLLIPFVALLGLHPTVVRLPMLLAGIASIPLAYYVGKQIFDRRYGLLTMFCLAISPWHILLSRLGLESNLFPFVFLAGFACLLNIGKNGKWFVAACILFGLCLYAYGTAYAMVPAFLLLAALILVRDRTLSYGFLGAGIITFVLIAIPIGLFIAVNNLQTRSIQLGPVTIPLLPVQARYLSASILSDGNPIPGILQNLGLTLRLLIFQSDGLLYNTIDPYGYFYAITFPLAVLGAGLLAGWKKVPNRSGSLLLLAWLIAAGYIGLLLSANVNRLNILFIPLIFCIATSIYWLGERNKGILWASVCLLFLGFIFFTASYHGEAYRVAADKKFRQGLVPAIQYATTTTQGEVCITDEINSPYIYVLFAERPDPRAFLSSVQYIDPRASFREVKSFLQYTFGEQNCAVEEKPVYVLMAGEIPIRFAQRYDYRFFDNYVVFYPKP